MHAGNTVANTEGCVLLGRFRDTATRSLAESRPVVIELVQWLRDRPGTHKIVVVDPVTTP